MLQFVVLTLQVGGTEPTTLLTSTLLPLHEPGFVAEPGVVLANSSLHQNTSSADKSTMQSENTEDSMAKDLKDNETLKPAEDSVEPTVSVLPDETVDVKIEERSPFPPWLPGKSFTEAENELRAILTHGNSTRSQRLEWVAEWLSKQDTSNVDALWPDLKRAVFKVMDNHKRDWRPALRGTVSRPGDKPRIHFAGLIGGITGLGILMVIYVIFLSRSNFGTARTPLISHVGYDNMMEYR